MQFLVECRHQEDHGAHLGNEFHNKRRSLLRLRMRRRKPTLDVTSTPVELIERTLPKRVRARRLQVQAGFQHHGVQGSEMKEEAGCAPVPSFRNQSLKPDRSPSRRRRGEKKMQRHDEERGLRSWSRRTARHEKLREKARGAMDEFIPGAMDARRLRVSFWRIGYAGGNGVVPTGNLQSRPAACCYVAVSVGKFVALRV